MVEHGDDNAVCDDNMTFIHMTTKNKKNLHNRVSNNYFAHIISRFYA
jgi:hypothetical protein